jgi:hypothetical protein
MSSTIMQSQSFQAAQPQAIGEALRELSAAAQHLFQSIRATLQKQDASASKELTPAEEANRVRQMATTYLRTDPGFAEDLFAAADRHERAHGL